ncbi:MAG: hypothetical protein Q9223_002433 [Gallowayella weberi]
MLHHRGTDKAGHHLDLLDTARCNGNWSEVPELVRKISKHAPHRKCLQLTAQAEYQIASNARTRPPPASSAPTNLSQLATGLVSAPQAATEYPEDAFQARVCLGWLHWTLNEPILALKSMPVNLADAYNDLVRAETTSFGWTRVCAIKGAYLQAPFRAWAELPSANTSRIGNISQSGMASKSRSMPRRRVWRLYYDTLSAILQEDLPYPANVRGTSTTAQEMSTDNVNAVDNLKLQQGIELRRVETIYEEILLKELPFPMASETSVEVESWIDQLMANWRVVSGPSWQNQDHGRGGKEAMTRNVLAFLYRAATRTFHSTRIMRHLFTVHTALAEFSLAAKAFDTYIELISKGKARVEKTGEEEVGLDDDATVLKATAVGLQMLCFYGRRKQVERAQEIAATLEKWLENIQFSSNPSASAEDNPEDLHDARKKSDRSVPNEAVAAAHRSLGVCRASWARLTYDVPSRPELQNKAIANLRAGLRSSLAGWEAGEIHYALALILAETRDIGGAIESVKVAISLCTTGTNENTLDGQEDLSGQAEQRKTRILFQAWHLLAYLLSSRQDFTRAVASCDAAYELYGDLIEDLGRNRSTESLSLSEREQIVELKMSQIAISEVIEGPGEAVNASGDILNLYKQLFDYGENLQSSTAPTASSFSKGTVSPPQSANEAVKSGRRSIFGRSKDAIADVSHRGYSANRHLSRPEGQQGYTETPAISVTLDGQFDSESSDRRYQPPHHLARQESKKLHKRNSRKSMASDHRGRGVSTNRSSFANEVDGNAQGLPSRVAEMKRLSLGSSHGDSSIGTGHPSEEVGMAVTHNAASDADRGSSGSTQARGHIPITSQSTHHKNLNPWPDYPKPPPTRSPKPSSISSHSTYSLPDPIYPSSDVKRHALTLLTRIWLFIAQLYRDAAMPVDAQGALSEAFNHAKSIEAAVAATESSAQALSEPGWGKVKSAAEVWADVHAEQAMLHLQLGNSQGASKEFEKALGWFPDHNVATVGLSNMLLSFYSQENLHEAVGLSMEESKPKPMLASLPMDPSSQTESRDRHDQGPEESSTLLSRLAARDRAYGLLSMLTKSGRGWDDSEAWFALARVYEASGQEEKAKEALWWVVELEEGRPVRDWSCIKSY